MCCDCLVRVCCRSQQGEGWCGAPVFNIWCSIYVFFLSSELGACVVMKRGMPEMSRTWLWRRCIRRLPVLQEVWPQDIRARASQQITWLPAGTEEWRQHYQKKTSCLSLSKIPPDFINLFLFFPLLHFPVHLIPSEQEQGLSRPVRFLLKAWVLWSPLSYDAD